MSRGLPFRFSAALWLLVAKTSGDVQMGLKSPYRPCAPPAFLSHGNPRTLSQCHTETRASLDANPSQSQKHPLGERGQPGDRSQAWPQGGGGRVLGDPKLSLLAGSLPRIPGDLLGGGQA